MLRTKDQQRFVTLSICCCCVLIIFGYCLQLILLWHEQIQINTEKTLRIQTLQKNLDETPDEQIPTLNTLGHLKNCGGDYIVKITQEKDISCDLACSYQQLLLFLQKYAEYPEYIQTIHIVRDKTLLVNLRLKTPGENTL